MKNIIASTIIAGLALCLVGCDKPASSDTRPTGTSATSSTKPEATAKPDATAQAAEAAPAKSTANQSTAEGAMKLFVESVQKGDFRTAAGACDPASQGFNQVDQIASAVEQAKANAAQGKGEDVTPMLMNFFTKPYKGATYKKLAEQDVRARYELTLVGDPQPRPIDLSLVNGKWYLIAPENILQGDKSTLPAVEAPKPAAPAPAPAPAPAKPEPTPAPAPAPAGGETPKN